MAQSNGKVTDQMRRIDGLLAEVDRFPDAQAKAKTRQIVEALMDLHGSVLGTMLERIAESDRGGVPLIESLAQDDLVSGLLLLYGLHPVALEERVGQALEKVRPYLHSHGGNVELLGIADGVVSLRLHGSCHGCPSSAMTLKTTIEEAILEKAPDVTGIEVENETTVEPAPARAEAGGRVALPILK